MSEGDPVWESGAGAWGLTLSPGLSPATLVRLADPLRPDTCSWLFCSLHLGRGPQAWGRLGLCTPPQLPRDRLCSSCIGAAWAGVPLGEVS